MIAQGHTGLLFANIRTIIVFASAQQTQLLTQGRTTLLHHLCKWHLQKWEIRISDALLNDPFASVGGGAFAVDAEEDGQEYGESPER